MAKLEIRTSDGLYWQSAQDLPDDFDIANWDILADYGVIEANPGDTIDSGWYLLLSSIVAIRRGEN